MIDVAHPLQLNRLQHAQKRVKLGSYPKLLVRAKFKPYFLFTFISQRTFTDRQSIHKINQHTGQFCVNLIRWRAGQGYCTAYLLLPRTNNLILFMSIQRARDPLGKFVRHWWRHKRSTVKQAKICSQLPSYWVYFWTTKRYKFDISP